jgi:hypothetical protein
MEDPSKFNGMEMSWRARENAPRMGAAPIAVSMKAGNWRFIVPTNSDG